MPHDSSGARTKRSTLKSCLKVQIKTKQPAIAPPVGNTGSGGGTAAVGTVPTASQLVDALAHGARTASQPAAANILLAATVKFNSAKMACFLP